MTTTASPLPTHATSLADGGAAMHDASSNPSSAPQATVLTCTACGGDNALDSRFCRHCGATLRASEATAISPISTASADASNGSVVTPQSASEAPAPAIIAHHNAADDALHPHSVAEGVDKGRAQHLVERAERMSERGELNAAILACRQAIALTPQLVSGHAILGALLERTGDIKGAMSSYEHVVELWPDSPFERERLRSLRAQVAQNGSTLFHFDANELFPEPVTVTAEQPTATTSPRASETAARADDSAETNAVQQVATEGAVLAAGTGLAGVAAAGVPAANATPFDGGTSPSAAQPTTADLLSTATTSLTASGTPSLSPARVALPSAATLAAVPSISALPPVGGSLSGLSALPVGASGNATGAAPGFAPLVLEPERATRRRWDSSYFWRGAPLTASVGAGLLFMIWAANWSAARRNDVLVPLPADTTTQVTDDPALTGDNSVTAPGRLEQGVPGGGPNVVQPGNPNVAAFGNGGGAPAPPAPNVATNQNPGGSNVTSGASRTGGAPASNGGATQRTNPSFPSVRSGGLVPPLPVSPRSVVNSSNRGGDDSSSPPRMSPPQIPSAGSPPISLGNNNAGSGAASTGGAPINPVYGGGQGYIRLHTGPASGSSAPTRSSNQAGNSERDAGAAARSGQGSRALNDASNAINKTGAGDPNLAFRFQTRALLFLEQGDNARAIDDFNTAIQAYQDQIARDPTDSDAREGIDACRHGLRLAQRRLGR